MAWSMWLRCQHRGRDLWQIPVGIPQVCCFAVKIPVGVSQVCAVGIPAVCASGVRIPVGIRQVCGFAVKSRSRLEYLKFVARLRPGWDTSSWWLRGNDPGPETSSSKPRSRLGCLKFVSQVCGFAVETPVGIPQVCGFVVKTPVGIPQVLWVCGQDPG